MHIGERAAPNRRCPRHLSQGARRGVSLVVFCPVLFEKINFVLGYRYFDLLCIILSTFAVYCHDGDWEDDAWNGAGKSPTKSPVWEDDGHKKNSKPQDVVLIGACCSMRASHNSLRQTGPMKMMIGRSTTGLMMTNGRMTTGKKKMLIVFYSIGFIPS